MTFAEVSALILGEMRADGDSSITLPKSAPYYSTPFGIRLALILKAFSKDTYLLFSPNTTITVVAGDREFSFADTDNCDVSFFDVQKVWLDNYRLDRLTSVRTLLEGWSPLTPSGTPRAFAQFPQSDKIIFDIECAADLDNCYVQGWHRHPTIAADTDDVLIPDEYVLELFEPYAQANLRRNVAQDDVGLTRLQMISKGKAEAVRRLKGENLRAYLGTMERY